MKMKKFITMGLSAVLSLSILSGCGNNGTGTNTASADSSGAGSNGASGKVYYLNFKPEQDPQWQELAKTYTEKTGVPVTVVTAASGE